MNAGKKWLLFLCFLCITSLSGAITGFSQQYTYRDQEEIAYQAQLTVSMYQDLLNVISYADLATESEIKKLITNSYTNSRSQLFYSAEAIIEDNIKPSNLETQHEQDKTIQEYLNYFDLAYEKSDQSTIDFYDFEVSNLRQGRYLYIKVKYTSSFKGKHKEDPTPYQPVDRVAELRVEKRDQEWKTLIASIVYYRPENPVSAQEGNVELKGGEQEQGTFSRLTARTNNGEGQSQPAEKRSDKFSEQKKEQDSIFNHHLAMGKRAMQADELENAFFAFSEAEKIYPFHQDLQISLRELARAQNLKISTVENSFAYIKEQADKAYAARDYIQAKHLYSEAFRMRPEQENLKVLIRKLETIIQKVAILESKYAVGDYQAAVKEYSKAIKADRNNADYYYGRGKAYDKLNAVKEALQDYSKAIALDGNFIEALAARAQSYAKSNQYPQAIADYTLILSNPAYAADYYPKRARIKKQMGDVNGALKDYNAAIELNPEEAENYFQKGKLLLSLKNNRRAIEAFSQAIEKNPQHVNAIYERGLAQTALGNLQPASADFEVARKLGLEKEQQAEINKLTFAYYAKAEGALAENKYTSALESLKNALLLSPAFGQAWLRTGDVYFIQKEYEKAISNYGKAITHNPVSFAYFKRGLAFQEMENYQAASQDFKSYLPIGKEVLARAEKPNRANKPAGSLEANLIEDRAEACYALGYAQLMSNQFVEALENFDMAIHVRKFFPKAYFARGAAFYALEDYKRAVKNMEESVRMGHSEPLVFYSLGKAYIASGQLQDAVYSFSHAIELDPKYEAAYKERALSYKALKQYALALKDIKTAQSLNEALNKDVSHLAQKGLLELYLNEVQEAKQSFDQALRLDGTHGWALYGKAGALAKEQKIDESLRMYRKAFQTQQIEWAAIKNDPLIDPVSKQKAFREMVKTYLN